MLFKKRAFTVYLILALLSIPLLIQAETPARQNLFKIERSKNANIIQYDAQVEPDGKLQKKAPVVAYWVRLAEQGQVQELSWVQRKFAFGFNAKLDPNRERVELDMAADFGRPIIVIRNGDEYRATAPIDGSASPELICQLQIARNPGQALVASPEACRRGQRYSRQQMRIDEANSPAHQSVAIDEVHDFRIRGGAHPG